jgi:hypothetical protein
MFQFLIARFEQAIDRSGAPALVVLCLFVSSALVGL